MYYRIAESLDKKIIGTIWPQTKDTIYPININDPRFIKFYFLRPLDEKTVAAIPVIKSSAKLTDLLSALNNGTSFRLTISDKLKQILEPYVDGSLEFFPITIQHKGLNKQGYWLTNILSVDNEECLDYSLSEITEERRSPEYNKRLVYLESHIDFVEAVTKHVAGENFITITKPVIKKGIAKDIIVLRYVSGGGLLFYVSEKLKEMIQASGCTGIVFHPIEQAE